MLMRLRLNCTMAPVLPGTFMRRDGRLDTDRDIMLPSHAGARRADKGQLFRST